MKVNELYKEALNKLNEGGIESAQTEARELICEALGLSVTDLYLKSGDDVSSECTDTVNAFCERRLKGEPLQYIIGKWDFMGRTYKVGPGVLIPRPETELLCNEVIKSLKTKEKPLVYDLCAGSGCIGITLKSECPDIYINFVEKSDEAFNYLDENISTHLKNTFLIATKGDIFDSRAFKDHPAADIIVSNPPYIKTSDIGSLQKEVTFEPEMALDGGDDGLDFYRNIIFKWKKRLKPDGEFFFEIGEEQGQAVCDMLKEAGFYSKIIKDYNNHDRIVMGRRKPYVD